MVRGVPRQKPFRTSVCQVCNNQAGIKADGPFLRSALFNNEIVAATFQHLDPKVPSPVPLTYLGIPEGRSFARNQQCEAWLTMASCFVYHLHEYHLDPALGMAGGNPIQKRREPGTVYYFNNTDSNYWVALSLMSIKKAFPGARRVVVDLILNEAGRKRFGISDPLPEDKDVIETLRTFIGGVHLKFNAQMLIDFDFRFMAKAALGIGCELFGENYFLSKHAKRLRSAMWADKITEAQKDDLPGRGYFEKDNVHYANAMGWPGGFTVALSPTAGHYVLLITWFGKRLASMGITDEFQRFRTPEMDNDGQVFVTVPQRSFWHGPVPWSQFVAYKRGQIVIKELDEARAREVSVSDLPQKRSK